MTTDLRWQANTDYICSKAYKKMWSIRRMKILDLDPLLILDVYVKEARHSGLTIKQSKH